MCYQHTRWRLVGRSVAKATVIIVAVLLGIEVGIGLIVIGTAGDIGTDFRFYRDGAARWLAGEGFYLAHQLAGPYEVQPGVDVLYPPTALLWFVPFTVLPSILWWALPLAVIGWTLAQWRPGYWTLAMMLILLMPVRAFGAVIWGNSDMWGAAAVAGGLVWGWPGALLALKPSVLLFAVVGGWARSFWVAAAIIGLASLAFWPMWDDYLSVISNANLTAEYSLGAMSLYMIPIVGWAAHRSAPWRASILRSGQPGLRE